MLLPDMQERQAKRRRLQRGAEIERRAGASVTTGEVGPRREYRRAQPGATTATRLLSEDTAPSVWPWLRRSVVSGRRNHVSFGTFAGFGAIHPPICFAKLASMAEGAEIASKQLWRAT